MHTFAKSQMSQLQDMGFEGEVARRALAKCAWDVNKALDYLVSQACVSDDDKIEEEVVAERTAEPSISSSEVNATSRRNPPDEPAKGTPISSPRSMQQTEEPTTIDQLTSPRSSCSDRDWNGSIHVAELAAQEYWERARPSQHLDDMFRQAARDVELAQAGKKLMCVGETWLGESGESSTLSVDAGDYVAVWLHSESEHGWIYAEHETRRQAGWLPLFALQPLLASQEKFMRAKTANDMSFSFEAGSYLRVLTTSRSQDGLVFGVLVEPVGQCTGAAGQAPSGWIPMTSLGGGRVELILADKLKVEQACGMEPEVVLARVLL
eukprot:CAMPEP_0169209492 /NCGR_PEP_ID=MMETSP1016-20121227/14698_1 /TAXON_ID=342587 /ORGANISM="Karlodinium micrum, Strain CCMP2283" /LENGTH=321 /DNA_ID=CAMNT_0009286945 /DNA_START=19 /DNA_END=985 /DNA_ORIENTATION=+